MTWGPSSPVISDLGYFQVVIYGIDVTYWNGIPCVIKSWASNEPFDDATAQIDFPQISQFVSPPTWLVTTAPVEINFIPLSGPSVHVFEGGIASHESTMDESGAMFSIHFVGAIYQLDYFAAMPPLTIPAVTDIGLTIANYINGHPGLQLAYCEPQVIGIQAIPPGGGNQILTGPIQDLLGQTTTTDGLNQWTLMKNPGRVPVIRLKDRTTPHWSIVCGAPGYTHQLTFDGTTGTSVVYGEGIDQNGCHWRNTKYPNLHPDDAPVWPGCYIGSTPACGPDDIALWEQRVFDSGYTSIRTDGVYDSNAQAVCMQVQSDAGILVDGIVGPQTWAATFNPGSNGGDLGAVFFRPLVWLTQVEPHLYAPNGALIGDNPDYNRYWPRIERWVNFGANISLAQGIQAAWSEISLHDPGFMGTITLKSDPDEGSRYLMRAGENLLVKSIWGRDALFHISQCAVDFQSETVTLTVDERARDLMTLQAVWARDRASTDLSLRRAPQYRNSRQTEDRVVVWDCEGGGGNLPRMGMQAGLWNVIHIPAGQRGTVASMSAYTDDASLFSIGVFDRPLTANAIASYGSPLDLGFWDQFGPETGLIIAWGSADQLGGTYGSSVGDPTGVFRDDASWYYESQQPPWLWLAFWCDSTTYIQGSIMPGADSSI